MTFLKCPDALILSSFQKVIYRRNISSRWAVYGNQATVGVLEGAALRSNLMPSFSELFVCNGAVALKENSICRVAASPYDISKHIRITHFFSSNNIIETYSKDKKRAVQNTKLLRPDRFCPKMFCFVTLLILWV